MKIHMLEAIGGNHRGASVGEILLIGENQRKMKVTEVEILDEATHRLTLED